MKPKTEWVDIKAEATTVEDIFANYAVILAAIPAISAFLGYHFFGMPTLEGVLKITIATNVRWAIVSYGISLASIYALSHIVDAMAPYFNSQRNLVSSTKVVVYAHTASWVSGIFFIIPQLTILTVLAGLYSLYLLYHGLRIVKQVPQQKITRFFAAIIFASIILSLVSIFIASILLPTDTLQ